MSFIRLSIMAAALLLSSAPLHAAAQDRAQQRQAFAAALAAFDRGDDDDARRAFERLREAYPQLADYHLHFLAQIHLRRGATDAAANALNALLLHHPRSVHAAAAALELGRLRAAANDLERAYRYFQRAVYLDDAEIETWARLELAKLAFRRGEAQSAYDAFTELRREARGTEIGRVAKAYVTTLRTQQPSLAPAGRDIVEEIELLLSERDFNAALFLADGLVAADSEQQVEAQLLRARALFGLDEDEQAFAALWRVVESSPRHPQAAAALYDLAAKLWNRDRDAAARRAFERYLELYPRAPKRVDARYAIARIHESAGRTDAAKSDYRELARSFPRHALASEARWRLAWLEYRAGEWWEAAEDFAELVERTTGRDRDAAMYWRARCHQRLGNADRAQQLYRTIAAKRSYYGMWAARRLHEIAGEGLPTLDVRRLASASTVTPPVRPGTPPAEIDRFHWSRFVELVAIDRDALAHAELAAIEEAAGAGLAVRRFLFDAYRALGRYDEALRLLARLGSSAGLDSSERRRTLYPLAYWEVVRDEAHRRQVDPLLVLGLMRQESLFDPEARSPANAIGLLQLLPATARRMAAAPDVSGADPNELTDPQTNVRLGVYYLGGLLDLYGGDPFRALAAYNGGEAAVAKWRERWPDAEADEFVESITYRETRDYVKKVLGNYVEYKEIYQ